MGRRKPTPDEAKKLAPFSDLVGKIGDDRIAEMAGVPVEAVSPPVVAESIHEGGPIPESWLQDAPEPIRVAIRAAEANGWTYADLTGTGDDGDPEKGVSKRSGLTMAQMAITKRADAAESTVDLEPVPDPDEFRDETEEEEDEDSPEARAAAAPTVVSHQRHPKPEIMLKRSVNVEVVDPKGKITHMTLPMSLYRGRMALKVMDLVGDPALYDVIIPL